MKVILREKVPHLGKIGDVVDARGGFARNFLLPRGKALLATPENLARTQAEHDELEKLALTHFQEAQTRANHLNGLSVTIRARAGEGGKLFGSVGTRDIAEAITAQLVPVGKSEVRLPSGAIRIVGEYEISLDLHADIDTLVQCKIVPDDTKIN
jgi:large subunit ribosomal protein L9